MVKPVPSAALLGALLAATPVEDADAQMQGSFTLKPSPERSPDVQSTPAPRIDLRRIGEDPFDQPPDLFGIPLAPDSADKRERGFSFTVRPVKGVRAVARLRF